MDDMYRAWAYRTRKEHYSIQESKADWLRGIGRHLILVGVY